MGTGPTALDYVSSLGPQAALEPDRSLLAAALLAGMAARRKDELDRGVSLVGPHRDDLLLRLGPSPAKGYASHGEAWSYALALRLASYDLLKADGGEPVLILDDVFAELDDGAPQPAGGDSLLPGTQVLVTAAVPGRRPCAGSAGPGSTSWPGRCTVSSEGPEPGQPDPPDEQLDLARTAFAAARQRAVTEQPRPRPSRRVGPAAGRRHPTSPAPARMTATHSSLGRSVDRLLSDRGWQTELAVAGAVGRWDEVVGPEVAAHVDAGAVRGLRSCTSGPTPQPGRRR